MEVDLSHPQLDKLLFFFHVFLLFEKLLLVVSNQVLLELGLYD